MLLLPGGQRGEAWEPAKGNALPEIGERWVKKKTLPYFFTLKGESYFGYISEHVK
jgi:hypothetical protein